jgi:hypothetical protein
LNRIFKGGAFGRPRDGRAGKMMGSDDDIVPLRRT